MPNPAETFPLRQRDARRYVCFRTGPARGAYLSNWLIPAALVAFQGGAQVLSQFLIVGLHREVQRAARCRNGLAPAAGEAVCRAQRGQALPVLATAGARPL